MLIYSIVMMAAAVLFMGLSAAIYRGRTDLIHDYHQKRVCDKRAYGRDFGKALSVVAAALLLSGGIGLIGDSDGIAMAVVGTLLVGIGVGIGCIVAVHRKYNRGVF